MARKHVAYFSSSAMLAADTMSGALPGINRQSMFIPKDISPADAQWLRAKDRLEQENVVRRANSALGLGAGIIGSAGLGLIGVKNPYVLAAPTLIGAGNALYQSYLLNKAARKFGNAPLPDYGHPIPLDDGQPNFPAEINKAR